LLGKVQVLLHIDLPKLLAKPGKVIFQQMGRAKARARRPGDNHSKQQPCQSNSTVSQ
jgi:hypothetical protein